MYPVIYAALTTKLATNLARHKQPDQAINPNACTSCWLVTTELALTDRILFHVCKTMGSSRFWGHHVIWGYTYTILLSGDKSEDKPFGQAN